MIRKPRMDIKDIYAALLISMGVLLFLVNLHILTIESVGNTQSVLNTTFINFLYIFGFIALLAMAFLIINFLKYLAWMVTTPVWLKKKMERKNK